MSIWTSWSTCLQALAGRGQREAAGAGRPHRQGLDPHLAASGVTLALQSSSWPYGDFFLGACPWWSWASRVWPAQGDRRDLAAICSSTQSSHRYEATGPGDLGTEESKNPTSSLREQQAEGRAGFVGEGAQLQ